MQSIRLKIRDFEIEGTGFETLEEFEPVLNRALEIWRESPTPVKGPASSLDRPEISTPANAPEITMNTFVARVGADSCRALLRASAGYLTIVAAHERIRHDDLITTAQSCSRWKKSYSNMMSKDLKRMIEKGEIIENASGQYSLPAAQCEQMRAQLGNG